MLIINNLTAGYDGKTVVTLPALQLKPGENCLIHGASGSGKTTLLYAMAGLGNRLGGTVQMGKTNLYDLSETARDQFRGMQVGMIFQTLHLVKSLTVLENLMLAPFMTGQKQEPQRALQLLSQLGIESLTHRSARQISQGQAQRVALARAVINRPSVLFADEPTSALDDHAAEAVMQQMFNLAQAAGTILVVSSHDGRIKKHFSNTIALGD